MNIGIITNMPAPYTTPVFEAVAKLSDSRVFVLYETLLESNRHWQPALSEHVDHVVMRHLTLDLRRLVTDAYLHVPLESPVAALRRFRADVVVAAGAGIWSSPANVAALAARRWGHWAFVPMWGSFARARPTLARRLAEPWVRSYVQAGDAWITYGSRSARDVIRLGADVDRVVISPAVAEPRYALPTRAALNGPGMRFLFVGQLIERKGIIDLVEAFLMQPDGELWIAGNGPLEPFVAAAAARNGRIRLLGYVDSEHLPDVYRAVDALVLPSHYEVWGLVVNEAMAFGLPVIVTDAVGALDDLVEPGVTGLVVPPGRSKELANAMREIAGWSPRRRESCARRAAAILQEWSVAAAAGGLREACEKALEHRHSCV